MPRPIGPKRFEDELERISARIAQVGRELELRRSQLAYLNDLAGAAPSRGQSAGATEASGGAAGNGRRRGKVTIEDGVRAALAGGTKLSTPELTAALRQQGVRAKQTSIHSAISTMAKKGLLVAHPHVGRGHAYTLG